MVVTVSSEIEVPTLIIEDLLTSPHPEQVDYGSLPQNVSGLWLSNHGAVHEVGAALVAMTHWQTGHDETLSKRASERARFVEEGDRILRVSRALAAEVLKHDGEVPLEDELAQGVMTALLKLVLRPTDSSSRYSRIAYNMFGQATFVSLSDMHDARELVAA